MCASVKGRVDAAAHRCPPLCFADDFLLCLLPLLVPFRGDLYLNILLDALGWVLYDRPPLFVILDINSCRYVLQQPALRVEPETVISRRLRTKR